MKDKLAWAGCALLTVLMFGAERTFGAEPVQLWLAAATLPVSFAFVWLYATDGWWKTWFGRSLMLLPLAVVAYTMAVVLYRTVGEYPGRGELLIFATGGTLIAMLIRTSVLWSMKRQERKVQRLERRS